ncbi:DUF3969 family protein [Saccharibacillus sacchari]|uniref:DUF3969 family protein n=1 Tax=Saccharibacillus sacchari TaxID=456493 RepID=UPI0004B9618A|nr:DUF3969 family protein [Saccharibacillus sacchari]
MEKLKIELTDRAEIEKLFLTLALGMLDSLEHGAMDFEQAYRLFLRPYLSQYLENLGSREAIVEFFSDLCMLEDVARLVPNHLNASIESSRQEAFNLLKSIAADEQTEKFWVNNFDEQRSREHPFFEKATLIINEWNPAEIYPLLYEEYDREVFEVVRILVHNESVQEIAIQLYDLFKRQFGTTFDKSLADCEQVAHDLVQLKIARSSLINSSEKGATLMDLKKINSLTKYPSIQTYHQLGERGRLNDALTDSIGFDESNQAYIYEKVDGENSRIILLRTPDDEIDYLIGSREELLYAKGDRIGNPYGNIADFLKPLAEQLITSDFADEDWALAVIYQESYGGKTKASKNYSDRKTQSYRSFDAFTLNQEEFDRLLSLPPEKIAEWREHGNQPFYVDEQKQSLFERLNLQAAPLLQTVDGPHFPISLEETFAYLKKFETTQVGIESAGKAEGIVVRTADRKFIRKIRFEDYERTFRK